MGIFDSLPEIVQSVMKITDAIPASLLEMTDTVDDDSLRGTTPDPQTAIEGLGQIVGSVRTRSRAGGTNQGGITRPSKRVLFNPAVTAVIDQTKTYVFLVGGRLHRVLSVEETNAGSVVGFFYDLRIAETSTVVVGTQFLALAGGQAIGLAGGGRIRIGG